MMPSRKFAVLKTLDYISISLAAYELRLHAVYTKMMSDSMKTIDLNLSDYTLAQKLQLLETRFDSPEWHDAVLKDRQKAYDADKLTSSDWQQAKKRIKKNLACE